MQINIEISEDEIKQEILKHVVLNALKEPQKIKSGENSFYLIPWIRERFDKIATECVRDYQKEFGKDHIEWKKDFKSYIDELQMLRDDYEGIMIYINEGAELLKEREAQTVLSNRVCESAPCRYIREGFCPKCHQQVEWLHNRNYCGFCGQAVKWNDKKRSEKGS